MVRLFTITLLISGITVSSTVPWTEVHDRETLDFSCNNTTSSQTLLILDTIDATGLVAEKNITLQFAGNGCLAVHNDSFVIGGTVDAPLRKIFNCSAGGKISFGPNASITAVYPQWWGATVNDTANDHSALQAAINSFKRIQLPKGEYIVIAPLLIPNEDGRTIIGDDRFTTKIRALGSFNILKFDYEINTEKGRFVISDFSIQGKDTTDTACVGILAHNVCLSSFNNIIISRCYNGLKIIGGFQNTFYQIFSWENARGLYMARAVDDKHQAQEYSFYSCWFSNSNIENARLENQVNTVLFSACKFAHDQDPLRSLANGLVIESATDVQLLSCEFEDNDTDVVIGNKSQVANMVVQGCRMLSGKNIHIGDNGGVAPWWPENITVTQNSLEGTIFNVSIQTPRNYSIIVTNNYFGTKEGHQNPGIFIGRQPGLSFDRGRLGFGCYSNSFKIKVNANTGGTADGLSDGICIRREPTLTNQELHMGWVDSTTAMVASRSATGTNTKLSFGTASYTRMTIDNSGNIGIGTSEPKEKLDVEGGIRLNNRTSNLDNTLWTQANQLFIRLGGKKYKINLTDLGDDK